MAQEPVVKFTYLRDPKFKTNRTLTVARRKVSDDKMEIAYSINLVKKELEGWRQGVPEFVEYEYDVFTKERARLISKGRLNSEHRHEITKPEDVPFYEAVLRFLANEAPEHYANRIGKHYLDQLTD